MLDMIFWMVYGGFQLPLSSFLAFLPSWHWTIADNAKKQDQYPEMGEDTGTSDFELFPVLPMILHN